MKKPQKTNPRTINGPRRLAVLERDGHRCQKCGLGAAHGLEIHHIKEYSRGGTNDLENLITLCCLCHSEWTWTWCGESLEEFAFWLMAPRAVTTLKFMIRVEPPAEMSARDYRDLLLRKQNFWGTEPPR